MNKRRWLSEEQAKYLNLEPKTPTKGRTKSRYYISEKDYTKAILFEKETEFLGVLESCNNMDIDISTVKHLWKKDGNASLFIKNPDYIENGNDLYKFSEKFEEIVKKYSKGVFKKITKTKLKDPKAIKITTSDDHLGLDPNPNNNGLFQYEYSGDIYKQSIDKVFNSIMKEYKTHGKFDLLLLDNLGDEQDGWNGYTTRGGHKLDQNMTNDEVFDVCVDTKINLIINLVENNIANRIILRKVVNDNHSGDFGLLINKAVEKVINRLYSKDIVEIEHLTRFLEHRTYGKHTFILTHGKDKEKMFKGFPLHLNDKTINQINDYIRFYKIDTPYIHVEKGDLHQIGYQKTSNFDYRNFMSFAPPSSWVQHNFGDSYSGYSIQIIPKYTNEISHTDYFLDYKKEM